MFPPKHLPHSSVHVDGVDEGMHLSRIAAQHVARSGRGACSALVDTLTYRSG